MATVGDLTATISIENYDILKEDLDRIMKDLLDHQVNRLMRSFNSVTNEAYATTYAMQTFGESFTDKPVASRLLASGPRAIRLRDEQ
jgi:hypothetical protein